MKDAIFHRALGIVLAAFLSSIAGTGCSLGVDGEIDQPELPGPIELLEFESPHEGLVFGAADDEQRDLPGLLLTARVLVRDLENDVWLEDIGFEVRGADGDGVPAQVPVHVDRSGSRCAEIGFTFFPGDELQNFELVARAGNGLQEIRRAITIAAAE